MADVLRIKRRASGGAGAPSALANAELAFNEVDNTLYYGKGDSGGNATSIIPIGGPGAFQQLVPTQDTAPTGVADGALWFDTVSGQLFIFYVDPAGPGQWVQANNPTTVPSVMLDELFNKISELEARLQVLEGA